MFVLGEIDLGKFIALAIGKKNREFSLFIAKHINNVMSPFLESLQGRRLSPQAKKNQRRIQRKR
jgi:hypothetical protein